MRRQLSLPHNGTYRAGLQEGVRALKHLLRLSLDGSSLAASAAGALAALPALEELQIVAGPPQSGAGAGGDGDFGGDGGGGGGGHAPPDFADQLRFCEMPALSAVYVAASAAVAAEVLAAVERRARGRADLAPVRLVLDEAWPHDEREES